VQITRVGVGFTMNHYADSGEEIRLSVEETPGAFIARAFFAGGLPEELEAIIQGDLLTICSRQHAESIRLLTPVSGDRAVARREGGYFVLLLPKTKSLAPAPIVVRIPAAAPTAAGTAGSWPYQASDRKRVLIVEDDGHVAAVLRDMVEVSGYDAEVAVDGLSALQLALRDRPDLITLDYSLPRLHGDTVLRALKNEPATAHIPVIMISARARELDADDCRGAVAVLEKPFDIDEVAGVIERAMVLHALT